MAILIGIDVVLGINLTALTVFSGAFGLAIGLWSAEDVRQSDRGRSFF